MGYITRYVVLILVSTSCFAAEVESIKPGSMVPDFTMAAENGFGQRLQEARGSSLMLIWLGRCDACSERLVRYQLLAESLAMDGLKAWFIWVPRGNDEPPNMRLPVLKYDPRWPQSWVFKDRPAIMYIDPDGRMDHLITGDLEDNYVEAERVLMRWLSQGRDGQVAE